MNRPVQLGFIGLAVLTGAALLFGGNPHPHFWWEAIPVWSAVFGYVGAWLLSIAAKSVLAPLLHRADEEGEE